MIIRWRSSRSAGVRSRGSPIEQTLYRKLRPGPGSPPNRVRANQLARLHGATTELVAEAGLEGLTVRRLSAAAGVSTRTFYDHFGNVEDCLASVTDAIGERLLRGAAERGGNVKELLHALTRGFADRPKSTRLLLVEVFDGGHLARERADLFTSDLEQLLAARISGGPAGRGPRRLVLGVAAGVVRVARTTSLTSRADELPTLAGPLADWALDCEKTRRLEPTARRQLGVHDREPPPLPGERDASNGHRARHGERERMLAAAASIAAAEGFDALSVTRIRQEAGVSRRAFDARFSGAAECFLASVESTARAAVAKADSWASRSGGGEQRLKRTVLALCAQAAHEEPLARLVLTEVLAPGRAGLLHREHLLGEAAKLLGPNRLAAEASAAATWRIAETEIVSGRARRLPTLAPLFAFLALSAPAG